MEEYRCSFFLYFISFFITFRFRLKILCYLCEKLPALMCLKLCLTILFVLCCCCGKGQNEVAVENDSILMAYYKKCKANLDSPIALDMCDTLFVRSEKAGNRRLMAIAKCLKLDYYYYKNDEENILKSVKEAKLISRKYNQLKYYYFAWGSRLIIYYLYRLLKIIIS